MRIPVPQLERPKSLLALLSTGALLAALAAIGGTSALSFGGDPSPTPTPTPPCQQSYWLWAMEEGSGDVLLNTEGSHSNDASIIGGPTWVSPGKVGSYALAFNGLNQYALVADDECLRITTSLTLSLWVKPEQPGDQDLIKKAKTSIDDGYELSLGSDGHAFFRLNQKTSGDTYRLVATAPYPTDGQTWVHLAATYDQSDHTMRLYVNGFLDNEMEGPSAIGTSASPIGIAAEPDGVNPLKGEMDQVRIQRGRKYDCYIREEPGPPCTPTPTPRCTSSLAGYWAMEEGSGATLVDSSPTGDDATTIGDPTWVTPGKVGSYALHLSGAGQYAVAPDYDCLRIMRQITLSAWVKPEQKADQVVLKKGLGSTDDGYELSLGSNGKAFFRLNQKTSGDTYRVDATVPYPIDGNTWVHLAVTYDGQTMRLYVNGTLNNSGTGPSAIGTSASPVSIGAESDGANEFKGQLDEVQIHTWAVYDCQIREMAGLPSCTPTPPTPTPPPPLDSDKDGLRDIDETSIYHTDPFNPDTDSDGLNDGDEVALGSNPLDPDSDDDSVLDGSDNCLLLANPDQTNTDADDMGDLCDPDDDNDGLSDGDEISIYLTDPLKFDTDGDGLNDGFEVSIGTSPSLPDTDDDSFSDRVEHSLGSDPLNNASVPEHKDNEGSCSDSVDNDLDGAIDSNDSGCVGGPPPPDVRIDTGVPWTMPDGTTGGMRGLSTTVTKTVTAVSVEITIAQVDGVPPVLSGLMTDTSSGAGTAWAFTYTPPFEWPRQSMSSIKMCLDTDGDGLHDDGCELTGVFLVDPSGVVSDAGTGMPISGATVTLERLNSAQSAYQAMAMPLDGGMLSPEVNPQLTGEDGRYAWDVVPGEYRVQVEKVGCDDATSRSVMVPPPATDLDVGLTCPDTDGDGLKDYREIEIGTNPSDPDTDHDGLGDGREVQLGTDPRDPDTDKDSALDGSDNCPLVSNPDQANNDGGRRPNGSRIPGDWASNPAQDKLGDACDPDNDNDGLPDAREFDTHCPYRLVADSDGDGVLDGFEVANGYDPCNAALKPIWVGGGDTDGDGLLDGSERGGYNTCAFTGDAFPGYSACLSPQDSDGDGCSDNVEALDLNGDRTADQGDQGRLNRRVAGIIAADPVSDAIFDVNKDGFIDSGDQGRLNRNTCTANPNQLGCPMCPAE